MGLTAYILFVDPAISTGCGASFANVRYDPAVQAFELAKGIDCSGGRSAGFGSSHKGKAVLSQRVFSGKLVTASVPWYSN